MEHSRLLKFIGAKRKSKMAENQPIVESEVPGTQHIRGDAPNPEQNDVETTKPKIISSFIEVHTEVNDGEKVVRRHQVIRNGDHDNDTSIEERNKTKIPISRLRQTVEKVKAKRQNSMEKAKKEFESQIPIRRTSVPKSTDPKRSTEDEFDKLYQEVLKADDTVVMALETKFEEIIHDYDENKLQPIDVEKVRRSKIPYLKRRSLQDAEGTQERNSRIIAAREKVKLRKSLSNNDEKYEKMSQVIVNTLNKKEDGNNIGADGNNKEELRSVEIIQVNNEQITQSSSVIYTNNETGEVKFKIDTETEKCNPTASILDDSGQKEMNVEPESSAKVQKETSILKTVSVEQDTNETKTTEISEKYPNDFKAQRNEIDNQIEPTVIKSKTHEHTETNETQKTVEVKTFLSYKPNEEDFIKNKLDNITIETEKLHEDIKTFARTNSEEFDNNLTTLDVEATKREAVDENAKDSNIENDVVISQGKTQFNNSFIDSYLRSRVRNFGTEFDDGDKINTLKHENTEKTVGKELQIQISDQKDEKIRNRFFDTPKDKNNTITSFEKETSNIRKHNKPEISDTLALRDKVENNVLQRKKEIANNYEVKERDGEFVTTFKGKVGRLISKIDSKEQIELESQAKIAPGETLKKKSVLSKIAMFESLESETPIKTKPKPKPLKLITKDIQPEVKTHVHVHTPLIVNEIFKPFYAKTGLNTNIEPLNESDIERQFIDEDKELYSDENRVEIAVKNKDVFTDLNTAKDVVNEQIFAEEIKINDDISNKLQKQHSFEPHKEMGITLEEVIIADTSKYFKYENPEPNTPINDAPVIIPKVRPVREILSKFEPKYKNLDDNEVFHKGTFRTKVKEALDELKQADIDVKHIVQVKNDYEGITEQKTFIEDRETTKTEDKKQNFDTFTDKTPNLQDLTENLDIKSIKSNDPTIKTKVFDTRRATSVADLYPGQVKGKISNTIVRLKSYDRIELDKKEVAINIKEMPRKRSVSEKIALFERKLTPINADINTTSPTTPINLTAPNPPKPITPTPTNPTTPIPIPTTLSPDQIQDKIRELQTEYQAVEIPTVELSNGLKMPVIAVGTANLEPVLIKHIIGAAIDMGYRAIDTAYIYGNEQKVGEAIRDKIQEGTVKREDLFIISKLWSTFHREDLVEVACNNSLRAMGLDYFDLYLIHNPMSFKEGPNPLPKIATVLQYSTNDYMNAWYGMEPLVTKGLVRGIGVSNFNSTQVARVMERGRVKPVVNQVECHPYLSQERLDDFCAQRNITLSCFGVLGSKGTPPAYRGTTATAIDDPLVKVMASGLHVSPAQLLIAYQLKLNHTVVVKSSSAAHLWDNLQALKVNMTDAEISGLRVMHRNKRIFTFAGMGDTHKNYPFKVAF